MARTTEIIEHLVDDIDGSTAVETVTFVFEGTSYEIDLNKKNAKNLRSDIGAWVEHARRVRAKNGTRRVVRSRAKRETKLSQPSESAALRAWATANGIAVNSRGRIPTAIVEQYRAAK